jgi:hypothetical protein
MKVLQDLVPGCNKVDFLMRNWGTQVLVVDI